MNDLHTASLSIPKERIASKIFLIRDEKVILDFHLAEFYGIETRVLKQAVKRNIERFPADFMFELDDKETDGLISQFVIPSKSYEFEKVKDAAEKQKERPRIGYKSE